MSRPTHRCCHRVQARRLSALLGAATYRRIPVRRPCSLPYCSPRRAVDGRTCRRPTAAGGAPSAGRPPCETWPARVACRRPTYPPAPPAPGPPRPAGRQTSAPAAHPRARERTSRAASSSAVRWWRPGAPRTAACRRRAARCPSYCCAAGRPRPRRRPPLGSEVRPHATLPTAGGSAPAADAAVVVAAAVAAVAAAAAASAAAAVVDTASAAAAGSVVAVGTADVVAADGRGSAAGGGTVAERCEPSARFAGLVDDLSEVDAVVTLERGAQCADPVRELLLAVVAAKCELEARYAGLVALLSVVVTAARLGREAPSAGPAGRLWAAARRPWREPAAQCGGQEPSPMTTVW